MKHQSPCDVGLYQILSNQIFCLLYQWVYFGYYCSWILIVNFFQNYEFCPLSYFPTSSLPFHDDHFLLIEVVTDNTIIICYIFQFFQNVSSVNRRIICSRFSMITKGKFLLAQKYNRANYSLQHVFNFCFTMSLSWFSWTSSVFKYVSHWILL